MNIEILNIDALKIQLKRPVGGGKSLFVTESLIQSIRSDG